MAFLGTYSYGIYLWHYPILIYFLIYQYPADLTFEIKISLLCAILFLSIASQKLIEQPIANLQRKHLNIATGLTFLMSFGLVALLSNVPLNEYHRSYKAFVYGPEAEQAMLIVSRSASEDVRIRKEVKEDIEGDCIFRFSSASQIQPERIDKCRKVHGEGVAIFGDSHAHDLYLWLAHQQKKAFLVSFSRPGCRLTPRPAAGCFDKEEIESLKVYLKNFRRAYYEESGLYMLLQDDIPVDRNLINSSQPFDFDFSTLRVNSELIEHKASILNRIASQVPLVVILPRYEPHLDFAFFEREGCSADFPSRDTLIRKYDELSDLVEQKLISSNRQVKGYRIANNMLSTDGEILLGDCEVMYWRDGDHYTYQGMTFFLQSYA